MFYLAKRFLKRHKNAQECTRKRPHEGDLVTAIHEVLEEKRRRDEE